MSDLANTCKPCSVLEHCFNVSPNYFLSNRMGLKRLVKAVSRQGSKCALPHLFATLRTRSLRMNLLFWLSVSTIFLSYYSSKVTFLFL